MSRFHFPRILLSLCALLLLAASLLVSCCFALLPTYAQAPCGPHDRTLTVQAGDTLSRLASQGATTYQSLAAYNHIPNPNLIYVGQHVCIPPSSGAHGPVVRPAWPSGGRLAQGTANVFPYPSCTWWASQRYYQLHGVWVPWTTQSNAWQWTARAHEFGWPVSLTPHVGAIVDMQPWVQGAYAFGHVAVVEQVLPGGRVLASNTSWGLFPFAVQVVQFSAGPGVTFLG